MRVIDHTPTEWQWSPPSLLTERDTRATGCTCNGNGRLGELHIPMGQGASLKRELACVCLYAVVDERNEVQVNREITNHFINNRADGIICVCMYCVAKRAREAKASEKVN